MIVVFVETAKADLDEIWSYIARDNSRRARSFVRELVLRSKSLSDMPRRHPLIPNREHTGIRRMPHGSYVIYYRVSDPQIEILRILNGAQDYEKILFPDEEDL